MPASRPIDAWISRSAFERLNVQTQAGQFGNAGRNIARGPAYTNVDLALIRDFSLTRQARAPFGAEVFNLANRRELRPARRRPELAELRPHPVGGQPRLMQFAVKLLF